MNVGYFSIQHDAIREFIDWNSIDDQETIDETNYLKHIRFRDPLCVVMDGKKQLSVVYRETCNKSLVKNTLDE
jgi:hypothetical protein